MSALPISGRTKAERLAAAVSAGAPRIVRTALDRLSAADRTVAAKIVAARFVERCAASAAAGDWTILTSFVDAACDRYAGIFTADELFAAALEAVSSVLRTSVDPATGLAFERARFDVEAAIARPRTFARAAAAHEAVDEVDVVLDDLLTQLDQSDALTAEHSRAVASWCGRLAKRLGSTKDEVVHLTRAGLIHDIGKVTTPPEILGAPRGLDDEEMAIMRRHAEAGAYIVHEVALIRSLTPAVRSHHERFDGTGYPDRLRFEAIPWVARVVAVADSFNAMIGRRPYRPPLAPSVALERLVEGRGEQFDPDIVDAMIDVVTLRA
ncbi:MAG TPA: HD domain-containing phosphohydrolase [Candidatus Limnocylindrales bacterium]|nr:HD domain-containing phosphohydrolase [Candidatus Limnocylindrales bacterium]